MGFRTVAIGRGGDKEKLAKDLGAHVYIDSAVEDATAVLQRMGGARAILATAPSGSAMGPLVSGLAARGKLIISTDATYPPFEVKENEQIVGFDADDAAA